MVVRDARSLTGRRLCLADLIAECPGEGQRAAADERPARFLASDRTYGARGVGYNLLVDGVSCGRHRIERLTRQAALRAHLRHRKMPLDTGVRSTNAVALNVLD